MTLCSVWHSGIIQVVWGQLAKRAAAKGKRNTRHPHRIAVQVPNTYCLTQNVNPEVFSMPLQILVNKLMQIQLRLLTRCIFIHKELALKPILSKKKSSACCKEALENVMMVSLRAFFTSVPVYAGK
jgi:hypothetical protein